jgi:hypothetical protein
MGSAMCFPVEAMVFYTLIQSAMHQLDGIRPTYKSINKYSTLIDIYGDDLIVPVEYTDVVVRYLESYALKVNINKSFRTSLFRESCGADYYSGVDVKPVYARQLAPDDARNWLPEHVTAWTETSNQLYESGQWYAAQVVRDMVSSVVGRPIPRSRCDGDGIYFSSFLFTTGLRYNTQLHGWKQKRIVYTPLKRKDIIDGDPIACFNRAFKRSQERKAEDENYDVEYALCHLFGQAYDTPYRPEQILPEGPNGHDGSPTEGQPECLERVSSSDGWNRGPGLLASSKFDDSLQHHRVFLRDRKRPSWPEAGTLTQELDSFGIDFLSSTYRGRYKPKYRWITVSQP